MKILIKPLALIFLLGFALGVHAEDLGHSVMGADETDDVLGASKASGKSSYIIESDDSASVEKIKPREEDFMFDPTLKEVSGSSHPKKEFEDIGYTVPGTFEGQENYIEVDKAKMVKGFRKISSYVFDLSFIKNNYNYESENDIINRTIDSGEKKSLKAGALHLHYSSYVTKTTLLNTYWTFGAGAGYNRGKGIFVTGTRSDTMITLWEFPIEGGLGLEIPLSSLFKISGAAGPSVLNLLQNRSDILPGEKGKRKLQVGYGYFALAKLKVNLNGISSEAAYDLYVGSQITNLFMDLEVRHHSYDHFQDPIKVAGTSFGIGFSFEYL